MVFKIKKLLLISSIAYTLLFVQSTMSIPSKSEDHLKELSIRLDSIQVKNTENDVKISYLESTNAVNLAKIDRLEEKNSKNEAKIAEQDNEIKKLKARINTNIETNPLPRPPYSTGASVPSSCNDLATSGQSSNGLYLIKNEGTKKIEAVSCSFGPSVSQDFIGSFNVKTKNVHFYVQRNSNFATFGAVIPFDVARLNEGGAFNLVTGIFTAPVPGIYHFQFSAVKDPNVRLMWIYLQVNGENIGRALSQVPATGNFDHVSLSSSLRLKAGDKVKLVNAGNGGVLYDDSEHQTHFSGWLVDEDLI